MTEVFIIPDGQHLMYYRQFGKYNRIEPIKMKDGNWCLPTRVLPHLEKVYGSIQLGSKRFLKRKDVDMSIIRYARDTNRALEAYPKRVITKDDIDDKYKEQDAIKDDRGLLGKIFNL